MASKWIFVMLVFAVSLFSILSSAHADLSDIKYSINVINGEAAPGDKLEYNVTFRNDGTEPIKLSLNVLFTGVTDITPGSFTLKPSGEEVVHVSLTVKSTQKPGDIFVKLFVFDDKGNQLQPPIYLQGKILPSPRMFENVGISNIVVEPSTLNPANPFRITFVVDNPVKNVTVPLKILADGTTIYEENYFIEEGSNQVSIENVSLPQDMYAGNHTITVELVFSDDVVVSNNINAPVTSYHKCVVEETSKVSIFGKHYEAKVKNVGTEEATCLVSSDLSGVEKLLLGKVTEGYTTEGGKIKWELNMSPFSEATVQYDVNYVPLLIIPFIIVGAIYAAWYFTRKVSISKELVDYKRHPGFMDLKIQVRIRNLTGNVLKHVKIYDPLPAFIKEVRDYGTIPGEVKKKGKEKVVTWEIDSLNPKEERVLSYKVRTSIEVLGSVNFKPAKVEYRDEKGEKKIDYSNILSIEIE